MYLPIIATVALITLSGQVHAGQQGRGGCLKDVRLGQVVCAAPDGGISRNASGQVVCGRGECVRDPFSGQVMCSSRRGGYATMEPLGRMVCTDNCEEASASNCRRPR